MNFSLEQILVTSFCSLIIGILLKYIEPKAKLVYWFPHNFLFNLSEPKVLLQTNSLTIQNIGRKSAEEIEIIHSHEPDFFEIHPSVSYEAVEKNGKHIVTIPFLGSKEFITLQILSYKSVPQILTVRSKEGMAQQIPITIQRLFPVWVNYTAVFLMLLGVATLVVAVVSYLPKDITGNSKVVSEIKNENQ